MRRPSKSLAVDPDRHYQLPHPDLVCVPPSLIERTQNDLLLYMSLWDQLGVQAGKLARDLADLEASGGCPGHLAQALSEAARMFLQSAPMIGTTHQPSVSDVNSPPLNGSPHPSLYPPDDDDVDVSIDPDKRRRRLEKGLSGGKPRLDSKGDLVDALESLGFGAARDFIENHGQARVKEALLFTLSKPPKSIKNITGFIVRLVEKPGNIPRVPAMEELMDPNAKYHRGRYGKVVQS